MSTLCHLIYTLSGFTYATPPSILQPWYLTPRTITTTTTLRTHPARVTTGLAVKTRGATRLSAQACGCLKKSLPQLNPKPFFQKSDRAAQRAARRLVALWFGTRRLVLGLLFRIFAPSSARLRAAPPPLRLKTAPLPRVASSSLQAHRAHLATGLIRKDRHARHTKNTTYANFNK